MVLLILLQTQQLSKSYGITSILSDIQLQIQSTDRIGLVGRNGAGKSTLLKMIAGNILPDSGAIQLAKGIKIGYLAQDSGLETNRTIWNEMLTIFTDLIEQEALIRSLEKKMAASSSVNEGSVERLMNEYARLTDDFREKGGYSYQSKIKGILNGLGFQSFDYHNQLISILSGGQKTRLALAKLLIEEPDLLILDEPTNYLDIETLTWLEGYLKSYHGAILLVSHDRYFLDSLVTTIYEIENTKATKYVGNYTKYIEQKEKEIELKEKQYDKQQQERKKLEEFVQKNIARASTTKRAQSRKKMLDRMDPIDKPITQQRNASFYFESSIKSGQNVLMIHELAMGFDNKRLFQHVSFQIKNMERVALIGPNGIGKSTLFKLIYDRNFHPLEGAINYGSNVKISYYAQEQDDLHPDKTVLDELWDQYPILNESDIRTILGNFLFIGDDVFKTIKDLSGGEKARVALAKLMLEKGNVLLLDEPTNHLDLFSREVLEQALLTYSGTILFISHDRYFLNKLTTRTIELTPLGINSYLGNYEYVLEKKAELEEMKPSSTIVTVDNQNKQQYINDKEKQKIERQLKRKIEAIELEIEKMEEQIDTIESELLQPEVYSDYQLSNQKNEELKIGKDTLEELLMSWEETQKKLEELS